MIAYLGRKVAGISLKESGRYFRRDPGTLSILVWRFGDKLEKDRSLRCFVGEMDRELREGKEIKYKYINV